VAFILITGALRLARFTVIRMWPLDPKTAAAAAVNRRQA
jgi:hypothetical protein